MFNKRKEPPPPQLNQWKESTHLKHAAGNILYILVENIYTKFRASLL